MSGAAWADVARHIPEIRRTRGVGMTGLALMVVLADAVNKAGEVFMTGETMRELTGTSSTSEIYKMIARFVELGWLTPTGELNEYMGRGRPTPVYAWTFTPGIWKGAPKESTSDRIGDEFVSEQVSVDSLETSLKPNNDAENESRNVSEPEPQPGTPGEPGREWGDKHEQIFSMVWAWEPHDNDRGRLQRHVRSDYRPIICNLVNRYPDGDADVLAEWAFSARNNGRPAPVARPTPAPSMPDSADWHTIPRDAAPVDLTPDPDAVRNLRHLMRDKFTLPG